MKQTKLEDQVALITGAGRPPAPAIALGLAAQGATVALNDLSPLLLDPVVTAGCAGGARIQSYVADATRGMPLRAMLDEVLSDWGRIDILVNNPRIQPTAGLLDIDEWDWQRTVEMNLNGPFLITQLVARLMREQGGGVILNVVDSNPARLEQPGKAAYAASQQGLLSLSQAAAREFMAYNIRVHTLCPDEAVLNPHAPDDAPTASPAPKEPDPGEAIARLAVFLCSPAAVHLPGQVFRISQAQVAPDPGAW